jgi:hypothetical protein
MFILAVVDIGFDPILPIGIKFGFHPQPILNRFVIIYYNRQQPLLPTGSLMVTYANANITGGFISAIS